MKRIIQNILNFLKYYGKRGIFLGDNVKLAGTTLSEQNTVGSESILVNSQMGYGSYLGQDCQFNRVSIGKYCSIGNNVRVVSSTHPITEFVSTHPAFYSTMQQAGFTYVQHQHFEEHLSIDGSNAISIGNDVWIGDDVMIMGGVTIGNGAVLAARALVTKNVGDYEIVGGVPAKLIRHRFPVEDVKYLLTVRWWDKPEAWIRENAELFLDIEKFKKKVSSLI
jgi:virginiamycin A acetyltransferase